MHRPFLFGLKFIYFKTYREWPINPKEPAINKPINKKIESPMRIVSALTVRSLPALSLFKKNNAENKLPKMTINTKTTAIFINIDLSK